MNIKIIVGATREGRHADKVSEWVRQTILKNDAATVEVLDLRDYPLEFFDEAVSPQYNPQRTPSEATATWLNALSGADAYIVVTPEYNRAISAVLKNALDYVAFELKRKPVAIVSYGGVGGAYASSQLRTILPQLGAIVVPNFIHVTGVDAVIDAEGVPILESTGPFGPQPALKACLDELLWLAGALNTAA